MFNENENEKMSMSSSQPEQSVRDINPIIDDIAKKFINEYDAEEQKQMLSGIRSIITSHYEELRQNCLKGAEDYGRKIDTLQS